MSRGFDQPFQIAPVGILWQPLFRDFDTQQSVEFPAWNRSRRITVKNSACPRQTAQSDCIPLPEVSTGTSAEFQREVIEYIMSRWFEYTLYNAQPICSRWHTLWAARARTKCHCYKAALNTHKVFTQWTRRRAFSLRKKESKPAKYWLLWGSLSLDWKINCYEAGKPIFMETLESPWCL